MLLPGTTVVISPLISLMHDQVQALGGRGVEATYFASTVPLPELRERTARTREGRYKLIYIAPERLGVAAFREVLEEIDCPLVAVDEAHCISEWGHDFRPDYLTLGELVESLTAPRALAAPATPVDRGRSLLRQRGPVILRITTRRDGQAVFQAWSVRVESQRTGQQTPEERNVCG